MPDSEPRRAVQLASRPSLSRTSVYSVLAAPKMSTADDAVFVMRVFGVLSWRRPQRHSHDYGKIPTMSSSTISGASLATCALAANACRAPRRRPTSWAVPATSLSASSTMAANSGSVSSPAQPHAVCATRRTGRRGGRVRHLADRMPGAVLEERLGDRSGCPRHSRTRHSARLQSSRTRHRRMRRELLSAKVALPAEHTSGRNDDRAERMRRSPRRHSTP